MRLKFKLCEDESDVEYKAGKQTTNADDQSQIYVCTPAQANESEQLKIFTTPESYDDNEENVVKSTVHQPTIKASHANNEESKIGPILPSEDDRPKIFEDIRTFRSFLLDSLESLLICRKKYA